MKITFLGTGTSQGIPVIGCNCSVCRSEDPRDKRLRTSALVETDGIRLVIDAGPDFRQQMLRAGVTRLDAILLTHEHKDHIGGMDDVRAYNYLTKKAVNIYSEERVMKYVMREYPYAFAEKKYPGAPHMNLIRISDKPFKVGPVEIVPIKITHYRLSIVAYRIGKFAYITDANFIPDESMQLLEGVEYLVINALRKEKHISHFSLGEALEIIRNLAPERAFITHISDQMGLYRHVADELPGNVILAYDGLVLDI